MMMEQVSNKLVFIILPRTKFSRIKCSTQRLEFFPFPETAHDAQTSRVADHNP